MSLLKWIFKGKWCVMYWEDIFMCSKCDCFQSLTFQLENTSPQSKYQVEKNTVFEITGFNNRLSQLTFISKDSCTFYPNINFLKYLQFVLPLLWEQNDSDQTDK